jgi:cobyrinic acid a,c-diamide synthase
MMGEEGVIDTFECTARDAEIAVVEGVMGLYDGVDGFDLASTAHVARLLGAPVILVVDVKGMSRSVHALIKGYRKYDPGIRIAGVILNRVGSLRHRQMIEVSLEVPALGWIPRREDLTVKSRHLGLVMGYESGFMAEFGKIIEETCDLNAIIAIAHNGNETPVRKKNRRPKKAFQERATIGVALDEAFCFYYQDNLDRLRLSGARLIFFSPIKEPLPDVDALYFGGGYPELHLPGLESSASTREMKAAADNGMPVYAECGGLIYLTAEIAADKAYRMCNVLPATAEMTKHIQALGYVKGESIGGVSFLSANVGITGHEFHYSRLIPDRDAHYAIRLSRGKGIDEGMDGLVSMNALGSYTHTYFTPAFAATLVDAAHQFSKK